MNAYHIHIEGIVQGVGFRPFVYKLALNQKIDGWVNNTTDGVHIHVECQKETAEKFLQIILNELPPLAIITNYSFKKTQAQGLVGFQITNSIHSAKPKLLLTPDVAVCTDCTKELYELKNKRFQYPFITCTNCGPRYSIMNTLPYDRVNTTMAKFHMCDACLEEYNNPLERRHYFANQFMPFMCH